MALGEQWGRKPTILCNFEARPAQARIAVESRSRLSIFLSKGRSSSFAKPLNVWCTSVVIQF